LKLDPLLNYAERHAWIITLGSASLGYGIGGLFHHRVWGWLFIGAGLICIAIRPVGTSLRRRILIREVRKLIDANKKVNHE